MTVLTEGRYPAEFIMSEGNFHYSRDQVTILSGSGVIQPGTVLGKITASGKYKPATDTGADGGQTAVAIALYRVDATSADAKVAVIARQAEVNKNMLVYDASVNDNTKIGTKLTQLAAAGIIAR